MSNQKIAGLLIPMATSEKVFKEFARYVKDSHPNNAMHLRGLLRYVWKKRKSIKDDDFDKEKIFKILFLEEAYKLWKMDKIYGDVLKMGEKFFLEKSLDENPHIKNFLLAKCMKGLELRHHAKRKLEKNFKNLPKNEAEHFDVSHKTNKEIYYTLQKDPKEKKKNRSHLVAALRDKEIESTITKLKLCCELISQKLILGIPYEDEVWEMIERTLAHIPYRDEIPIIDIQADAAFFLLEPTADKYFELKQKFIEYLPKLHSEKKEVLLYLTNSLSFINVSDIYGEYFDLYKIGVEKEYFLEKGVMSSTNFNNIVRIACQSNQLEWAKEFIRLNSKYLRETDEQLKNIQRLYSSFIFFAERNFNKALIQLEDLQLEDLSYGLNKHNLLIKCAYELHKHSEKEQMTRIIDSYKKYVSKKVTQKLLSQRFKIQIFNFLKMVVALASFPYKNWTKEQLFLKLDSYEDKMIDKTWLKEKIKMLKRY